MSIVKNRKIFIILLLLLILLSNDAFSLTDQIDYGECSLTTVRIIQGKYDRATKVFTPDKDKDGKYIIYCHFAPLSEKT